MRKLSSESLASVSEITRRSFFVDGLELDCVTLHHMVRPGRGSCLDAREMSFETWRECVREMIFEILVMRMGSRLKNVFVLDSFAMHHAGHGGEDIFEEQRLVLVFVGLLMPLFE